VDLSRDQYCFQTNFLTIEGNRLHYVDEGSGEPVVMVHGNPSWSFMFRKLILSLRSGFRVLAPDHIGCGLSDKPDDRYYHYTLATRISDLEKLLDHLQITEGITLVLHDWGGLIGFGFATQYPERIRRIVVMNTAAFHVPPGKKLHWTLRWCRRSNLAAWVIRRFNAFAIIASWLGCRYRPMSRAVRRAYLSPYNSWANRIATLRFIQDIPLDPRDESYQTVSRIQQGLKLLEETPLLVCWGMRDFVFDSDFLQEWIRRFPGAEICRVASAGHYVVEDAFEEISPRISHFLTRGK
jgi:haloalkane dehalogenase